MQAGDEQVEFNIQAVDFLARRTAVFGMTRTGKSNMVKKLVSVVKRTADQTGLKIGQIIYDLNGEYANANQQDDGAIADIYPTQTERYRMLPADGFKLIQNNFYTQIAEGHALLREVLSDPAPTSADLKGFLSVTFEQPEDPNDRSASNRWRLKCAIYQAVLFKAGFRPPDRFRVSFSANATVRQRVDPNNDFPPGNGGNLSLTPADATEWFSRARRADREKDDNRQPMRLASSTRGQNWLDEDCVLLLNLLEQKSGNDAYITGFKHLVSYRDFHSADRTQDVSEEIYQHLEAGKIVFLDLSVGDPSNRTRLSTVIARHIFSRSASAFNRGEYPPNIVIYVEEAHNIIGKKDALTATWPRIAKEGAKFRIATVYATQEISSIHPNILANTENMFVSHLNNESEIR
ncbi:helicase HerA domain-containing protein [Novipirellula sp.]|uniref:helicase HerA domain-containing protein n=1 Tax=Novipirellula sp. TaxID=2795430 RepID=UPI003563E052